jgi:hypothetical protein
MHTIYGLTVKGCNETFARGYSPNHKSYINVLYIKLKLILNRIEWHIVFPKKKFVAPHSVKITSFRCKQMKKSNSKEDF